MKLIVEKGKNLACEKNIEVGRQVGNIILGSLLCAVGVNLLIIPAKCFTGGFMGISQLIGIFITGALGIPLPKGMDITGAVYFIINLPVFYLGLKTLGKKFTIKTILTVAIQSGMMLAIPICTPPIISDRLTSCLIGGLAYGAGVGIVLKARSSGGGGDIVGLYLAKKYKNMSVGSVTIILNAIVCAACIFLYDLETVTYSLIFMAVSSFAIDRFHAQNINISIMIFSKKTGIAKAVMEETGRGVTDWEGEGAYTGDKSNILIVVVSKYEVSQIKKIVRRIDPNAFMILTEGCSVAGNYEKRL
ncbi:MAG: YitT family protein [Eubacteriales bacterium]|nr:YitT family protein [Eubacteriales bacterium]MDY3332298.1 YitT family protein [Gallibacter sp.]